MKCAGFNKKVIACQINVMSRAWTDMGQTQQSLALVGTSAAQHLLEAEFKYFLQYVEKKTGAVNAALTSLSR